LDLRAVISRDASGSTMSEADNDFSNIFAYCELHDTKIEQLRGNTGRIIRLCVIYDCISHLAL
jgi:hypothetical protein